jgi:hypothetical protein
MASGGSESWLGKQYNDIKGNLKWDAIKFLVGVAITAAYFLLQKTRHLEYDWWVAGGLFAVSILLIFLVGRTRKAGGQQLQSPVPGNVQNPAVPVNAAQPFDAREFFRTAYYSPALQAEVEARMRDAANRTQPTDREGFYLKFISLGALMYRYDMIWWVIYKSQLEALLDLNRNNGVLSLTKIRTHYDQASVAYPDAYKQSNLDQWLGFLITFQLIIRHPSDMIEITVGGKDFLKYLLHWGREANQRKF